jgi:putative flippase GtrA
MTVDHGPRRVRDGGMPQMDFVAALPRWLHAHVPVIRQISRYAFVSGLALALDFGVFLALNGLIALPTLAGVVGYCCGIVLHYHLSKRFVFDTARSQKSAQRLFSEFVASGFIGLAVTAGVIAVATGAFGLEPIVAKALAAVASFIGVFAIRRMIVFA